MVSLTKAFLGSIENISFCDGPYHVECAQVTVHSLSSHSLSSVVRKTAYLWSYKTLLEVPPPLLPW